MAIGALGLLIGLLIELCARYRSFSISTEFHLNLLDRQDNSLVCKSNSFSLLLNMQVTIEQNTESDINACCSGKCRWETLKRWTHRLIKTLVKRFRWGFILAGFMALAMAAISWKLESTESYWIWHRYDKNRWRNLSRQTMQNLIILFIYPLDIGSSIILLAIFLLQGNIRDSYFYFRSPQSLVSYSKKSDGLSFLCEVIQWDHFFKKFGVREQERGRGKQHCDLLYCKKFAQISGNIAITLKMNHYKSACFCLLFHSLILSGSPPHVLQNDMQSVARINIYVLLPFHLWESETCQL